MDPAMPAERGGTPEAEDFIRFCYRRRKVGWPDLYDEMCRVAHRGHYKGMGLRDLEAIGIGFSLYETPRLAALVSSVLEEELATRTRLTTAVKVVRAANEPARSSDDVDAQVTIAVAAAGA
jgi:hypothetical protein